MRHDQVGERLDGSPEPPPELGSRIPTRNRGHSEVRVDTPEHIQAAPVMKPRSLLTRVQPEGDGGSERERWMFADVVVVARVARVDCAGLHAVHYLEGGNEFAGRADLVVRASSMSLRAGGEGVVEALAAADRLPLVRDEPSFAHAFGSALSDKHGIFTSYRHLFARIRALLDSRAFLLSDLVEA